MTLRDTILNADDYETEPVDIPEWGVKVAVKSMTIAEQQDFLQAVRLRTGAKGEYEIDRKKFPIQLLIRTVIDPDTSELVFEQADADTLTKKSGRAVARILTVATRLSGLADDQIDETIDDLKRMASDDSN